MTDKTLTGYRLVAQWRDADGISITQLCKEIGDPSRQLQRWLSGERKRLPLRLKVRVVQRTGLPLERVVNPSELVLARAIVALIARDAAAPTPDDPRPAA